MSKHRVFATGLLFFLSQANLAWAFTPDNFTVVPQANGASGVSFSIGYTFGTHVGRSSQATGTVQAQLDPLILSSGDLSVPIAAMTTGDPTRDCHMREALGIDYTHSRFPGSHVCVSNQTPATGPDSIAFPEIHIRLVEVKPLTSNIPPNALRVVAGQVTDVQATLQLTIHGVTQTFTPPVRLSVDETGRVTAQASVDVKLADFGIVVKPAGPIVVKDHATVALNLLLQKQAAR
jgi:polyisoprenoid-binding protein YceI